jgi:lysophospholipid acyltransferase (LPLAT)-like uncharacterized protein
MTRRIAEHPIMRRLLAGLIRAYLRFAFATTRWRCEGFEQAAPYLEGAPAVAAFWHEILPVMPVLRRFARGRIQVLISSHRDGKLIAEVVRGLGFEVAEGSSRRGGAAAARRLLDHLASGGQIAITPDGPRGPRRHAAPGVAELAARAGVPVIPCGAATSRHWRLPSWDRMLFPLPFGRGAIVLGAPIEVPEEEAAETALSPITAALSAACARAEALCRS